MFEYFGELPHVRSNNKKEEDKTYLLFRCDVQISSMLIRRNPKSFLRVPIKILLVVRVLSRASAHSVGDRVEDFYVQLFQLKQCF